MVKRFVTILIVLLFASICFAELLEETKNSIAFKKLITKDHRDADKAWYEETDGGGFNIHSDDVWIDPIPETPPASSSPVIKAYIDGATTTALKLTQDVAVQNERGWYAEDGGVRLRGFIPPKYGQGYTVKLYEDDGTGTAKGSQIYTTDAMDWFFDYDTGYLAIQDTHSYTTPFWIEAYYYQGDTVTDGLASNNGESGNPVFFSADSTISNKTDYVTLTFNTDEFQSSETDNNMTISIDLVNASKIATGLISNTEYNYLDGVTNTLQTQINSKASKVYVDPAVNHASTEDAVSGLIKGDGLGGYTGITDNSGNWNSAYDHKTTEDNINGLVKCNGSGSYSAVTDNSANWNAAYTHKTTEDNINGLVKCDGSGNYSAVTDSSSNWNAAYTHKTTEDAVNGLVKCDGAGTYSGISDGRSLTINSNSLDVDSELYTDQTGIYIEDPAVESLNDIFWFMNNVTIVYVWCKTDVASSTVSLNIEDGSNNNILSAELVCDDDGQSSCASGCNVNTINTSYDDITAKTEDIDVDISATSGSPGKVSLFIGFTIND